MTDPTPDQHGQTFGEGLNRSYVAKDGDTLESIAAYFYGSDQRREAVKERNPSVASYGAMALVAAGMRLRVPDESGVTLSDQRGVTTGEAADRAYTTKVSDSLEEVATFFYGAAERRDVIEQHNPPVAGLDPWATLPPGLALSVPDEGSPVT